MSPTDVVVVGNIDEKAKGRMEEDANSKLRHRIHQWSVRKLIELLDDSPIHVVGVSESGTSSRDPSTGRRIRSFESLMIRTAVKGLKRAKVVKVALRVAWVNGGVLERRLRGSEHRVEVPKLRWGPRGVGLDGGPWGVGDAGEPAPRPSPANGSTGTHKYHRVPLAGKR